MRYLLLKAKRMAATNTEYVTFQKIAKTAWKASCYKFSLRAEILMGYESGPFDTIESAQAFMDLLAKAIEETQVDIELDLSYAAEERQQRREQALRLTLLKIRQLSSHVQKSSRLLNDLRTLRILMFGERAARESLPQVITSDAPEALSS